MRLTSSQSVAVAAAALLAAGPLAADAPPRVAAPAYAIEAPREALPRPGAVVLPVSFHFATHDEGHELLLTDVAVTIDDAATRGRVLQAVSDGPYLQASVPEGCYEVTATYAGRSQVAVIVVERGEPLRVAFYW